MDFKKMEEKLKYLVITELRKKFEFDRFSVEFISAKDGGLDSYEIFMTFNYNGEMDANYFELIRAGELMFEKVTEVVEKYSYNRKGELVSDSQEFIVDGPLVWDINYSYSSEHKFNCSYKFELTELL